MAAKLTQTTLDIDGGYVVMSVNLTVQDRLVPINCVASTAALLARALADGRTDWTTADCADEATAILGQPVTT